MHQYYFDDFSVGQVFITPGMTLTEGEIINFAMMYDPQAFHVDKVAAQDSLFGGLIASGFQTLALSFRLFMNTAVPATANLGGPGMDELRWLKPVRPGDTIKVRITVLSVTPSRSKADRGSIVWGFETLNQADDVVMTAKITSILRRRPAA